MGVRDWVCHIRRSDLVLAWADADSGGRGADVVEWQGKIGEEVA